MDIEKTLEEARYALNEWNRRSNALADGGFPEAIFLMRQAPALADALEQCIESLENVCNYVRKYDAKREGVA